jgi:hypothetical protein
MQILSLTEIPTMGTALTTTLAYGETEQPFDPVTVTTYMPVIPTAALLIDVFAAVLVKPAGPTQEYETPPDAERLMVLPAQSGLLVVSVASGVG